MFALCLGVNKDYAGSILLFKLCFEIFGRKAENYDAKRVGVFRSLPGKGLQLSQSRLSHPAHKTAPRSVPNVYAPISPLLHHSWLLVMYGHGVFSAHTRAHYYCWIWGNLCFLFELKISEDVGYVWLLLFVFLYNCSLRSSLGHLHVNIHFTENQMGTIAWRGQWLIIVAVALSS